MASRSGLPPLPAGFVLESLPFVPGGRKGTIFDAFSLEPEEPAASRRDIIAEVTAPVDRASRTLAARKAKRERLGIENIPAGERGKPIGPIDGGSRSPFSRLHSEYERATPRTHPGLFENGRKIPAPLAQRRLREAGVDNYDSLFTSGATQRLRALPQDDWATYAKKTIQNVDDQIGRQLGGFYSSLPTVVRKTAGGVIEPLTGLPIGNLIAAIPQSQVEQDLSAAGQQMFRRASRELERNAPLAGDNKAKRLAGDVFNAFVDLGTAVGLSAATGQPMVGTAAIGLRVFGDRFGQSIEEGRTPEQAYTDGAVYALAEMFGESKVVGDLMMPGEKFGEKVAIGALSEWKEELITEFIQAGYDKGVLYPEMKWSEVPERMAYAGLIGGFAGGFMAPFTRPKGIREEAAEIGASSITPEEKANPLPTEFMGPGRAEAARAIVTPEVNAMLAGMGLPNAGTRVNVTYPDGSTRTGTVSDAYETAVEGAGAARGVKVEMDDGTTLDQFGETLKRMGVRIEPAGPLLGNMPDPVKGELPENPVIAPPVVDTPLNTKVVVESETAPDVTQTTLDDASLKAAIRRVESGGNDRADNPLSSADGRYQFTDRTWARLHQRIYGGEGLSDKMDVEKQERLMDALLEENRATLKAAGIEADAGNLYAAHHFGAGSAVRMAQNPDAPLRADYQKANPHLRGMTNGQALAWARQYIGADVSANPRNAGTSAQPVTETDTSGAAEALLESMSQEAPVAEVAKVEVPAESEPAPTLPNSRLEEETAAAQPAEAASTAETLTADDFTTIENGVRISTPERTAAAIGRVQAALAEGRPVTLYADGKPVRIAAIAQGMLQDEGGQRWDTLGIATDKAGGNRIEIGSAVTAPEAKAVPAASPGPNVPVNTAFAAAARPEAAAQDFDPEPHIPALKEYVAKRGRSLEPAAIGKALNLTTEQAERALGALASRPNSGLFVSRGKPAKYRKVLVAPARKDRNGKRVAAKYKQVLIRPATQSRIMRVRQRTGPVDVIDFLRDRGGIRDDEGHDLFKGRNLGRHPGLISKNGMSADQAGEALHEAGYFIGERPTEDEALQFIEKGKGTYRPEDQAEVEAKKAALKADERREQAKDEIRAAAKAAGTPLLAKSDLEGIVDLYLSDDFAAGGDADAALAEYFVRKGRETTADLSNETDDAEYDIPGFEDFHDEPARNNPPAQADGEGREGSAGERSDQEGSGEARADPEEAGGEGQLDAFGTQPGDERRALERKGEGRLTSDKAQKAPGEDGGLLDTPDSTGERFSIAEGEPVARLTGDELGVQHTGPETIAALRDAAARWYSANLLGRKIETQDGRKVSFTGRGLRKATSKGETLLKAIPSIRAILERGELIRSRPGDDPGTIAMHTYAAPVEIAGQVRQLGVLVRETPDGDFKYDFTVLTPGSVAGSRYSTGGGARTDPASTAHPGELNLFPVDEDFNDVAGRDPGLVDELRSEMRRRKLDDKFMLNAADLLFDDPRINGHYFAGVATVALEADQSPFFTLDHETYHGFVDVGLVRPAERAAIRKAAKADPVLMASIERRYGHLSKDRQLEEAEADYFARLGAGEREAKGFIASALRRVRAFLEALGAAIRGHYRTPEAFVRAYETGRIGGRGIRLNPAARERFSITKRPRSFGIPEGAAKPLAVFGNADLFQTKVRPHPDYRAAKNGDREAALRLARDLVPEAVLQQARERFAGAVFVPPGAQEAGGRNKIPLALASLLADAAGGTVEARIVQANRTFHTGAKAIHRLVSRPLFEGPVEAGRRYVLVDDVTVLGGTLAELANHVQAGGGEVIGTALLVNASRNPVLAANSRTTAELERRFGDVVRNELGVEPAALTEPEAKYLIGFKDAQSLRKTIAKGRNEQRRRMDAGSASGETGTEEVGDEPKFSIAERRFQRRG